MENSVNLPFIQASNPALYNTGHVTKSASLANIGLALAKAQAKLEAVGKGEKGYGYNYASLASTIETAKPVLEEFGLSVTQLIGHVDTTNNIGTVTTILLHESGEYIQTESSIPLIEMKGTNAAQSFGAIVSYIRRYSLQAILNMASEDNDASSNGKDKPKSSTGFKKQAVASKEASEPAKKSSGFRRKKKSSSASADTGGIDGL